MLFNGTNKGQGEALEVAMMSHLSFHFAAFFAPCAL
jgi:hypothetical protein